MNKCQVLSVTFNTNTNKEMFFCVNFYIDRVIHRILFHCCSEEKRVKNEKKLHCCFIHSKIITSDISNTEKIERKL